jgi:hypothetical protein
MTLLRQCLMEVRSLCAEERARQHFEHMPANDTHPHTPSRHIGYAVAARPAAPTPVGASRSTLPAS